MKLLFAFLALCIAVSAPCQWRKVADDLFFPYNNGYHYGGAIVHVDGMVWGGISTLYSSPDTGKTWTANSLSIGSSDFIFSVDFFDKNNGIVMLFYGGTFITKNGGLTWSNRTDNKHFLGGVFGRTANNIVYVTRHDPDPYIGAISTSTDGGSTWKDLTIETGGGGAYHIVKGVNGRLYVLSRNWEPAPRKSYLYYSDDDGKTWVKRTARFDFDCFSMAVSRCDQDLIYVINEDYNETANGLSEVYRSTNGGVSFDTVIKANAAQLTGFGVTTRNAVYMQTFDSTILRSTDEGTTWKPIGGPNNYHDTRMLCAIDDNLLLASDFNGNIWRTDNSGGDSVFGIPDSPIQQTISTPRSIIEPLSSAEILVPITLVNKLAPKGFDLVVHYDSISYEYLGTFAKNGDRIDVTAKSWPGRALVRFRSTDIAPGTSTIGYTRVKIKWHEPFCDVIRFDSASSTMEGCATIEWKSSQTIVGNYPSCVLSVPNSPSRPISFLVQPNPSNGIYSLSSTDELTDVSVLVLDVLGKVVHEQTGNIHPGVPMTVDLTQESAGAYYLRLQCESGVQTIKLVKN